MKYYSVSGFPRLFLHEDTRMSFVLGDSTTDVSVPHPWRRLDLTLTGELANIVQPAAHEVREGFENFYLSHCGTSGVVGVHGYNAIVYEEVYPKIDLVFYSTRSGQKMAFVVRPGGDPANIRMQFTGQDNMDIDLFGALRLWMQDKWIVLPEAVAYQYDDSNAITPLNWTASFEQLNSGVAGLNFDTYNPALPLVFLIGPPPQNGGPTYNEPGLCWSTYLGGTNYLEGANESTQDAEGNYYVTGYTNSDFLTFPTAPGLSYSNGGVAAFLVKFDVNDLIVWKAYFGGDPGHYATGTGIGFKDSGKLYMAGYTNSAQLQNYQPDSAFYIGTVTSTGARGFIGRFDPADGQREWSSYFSNGYSVILGLAVATNKRLFVCGHINGEGMPPLDVAPPPGSNSYAGYGPLLRNGLVAMFNEADQLAWTSYVPYSGGEVSVYDVDATPEKVVIAGTAYGQSLPGMSNAYNGGFADCFVYEITPNCAFTWGAYAGSPGGDRLGDNALTIDRPTGDIIIGGRAATGLAIVPGPGWHQADGGGAEVSSFLVRYAHGTHQVLWSTYVHGAPASNTIINTLASDALGNLFVAGECTGAGLDLRELPGVYYQPVINTDSENGGSFLERDAFLMSFTPQHYLALSTYFGGNAYSDHTNVDGAGPSGSDGIMTILRRTYNNNVYFAGHTSKDMDPASYFPLDDGGGVPYFTATWQGGTNECVVAALCGDAITGMGGHGRTLPSRLAVHVASDALLHVFGLPVGGQLCEVYDATGRSILRQRVTSQGATTVLPVPQLASGAYVLRTDAGAVPFLVP